MWPLLEAHCPQPTQHGREREDRDEREYRRKETSISLSSSPPSEMPEDREPFSESLPLAF